MKNIIFDIGSVLWKDDLEKIGLPKEYFEMFMKDFYGGKRHDLDRGEISFSEFSKDVLDNCHLEIKPYIEKMIFNTLDYKIINYELFDYIKELKKEGFNIYILSDNYKENTDEFLSLNLCNDFDGMVFSFEEHCLKKDVVLFEKFLSKYNLKSSDCVFIDDRVDNLECAKKVGIAGINYCFFKNTIYELKEELRRFI